MLLALDTSGECVTAAVHDGGRVLAEVGERDARRHAEMLAPAVRAVLADAGVDRRDLTGVVVGVGPGPFTGLRVGVVTARVLGAALAVPVHGVCSLDAVAEAACAGPAGATPPGPRFVVATDARRHEVYWAPYAASRAGSAGAPDGVRWRREGPPRVSAPADVEPLPAVPGTRGPYPDVSAGALAAVAVRALAGGGSTDPDGGALLPPDPLYLRRPDAVEPGARKRVLR